MIRAPDEKVSTMNNLSFAARISGGFGVMIVLILLMASLGYWGLDRENTAVGNMMHTDIAVNSSVGEARVELGNLRRYEKDSFLNVAAADKVKDYRAKWNHSLDNARKALQTARAASSSDIQGKFDSLLDKIQHYAEGYNTVADKLGNSVTTPADANAEMEHFKTFVHSMEGEMKDLDTLTDERARQVAVEVGHTKASISRALLLVAAAALVAAVVTAFWVSLSIRRPLHAAQAAAQTIAANNDLTVHMPRTGNNEIGRTLNGFHQVLDGLRALVRTARADTSDVEHSASEMAAISEHVALASSSQAQASAAVAASIEELTSSIAVVSDSTETVRGEADQAKQQAQEGEKLANQAAEEIGRIAEALGAAGEAIAALNARSDEIGGIVRVIKEIADQTNLLALNAAIEAARAGESGRGFAVVADEVRKLAERTTSATVDISEKIQTVQRDTVAASERMQDAQQRIDSGVACAKAVSVSLDKIREGSTATVESITDISAAIQEQRSAAITIAQNVERIAQMSEQNHAAAASANDVAKHLGELSSDLKAQIHRYVVD